MVASHTSTVPPARASWGPAGTTVFATAVVVAATFICTAAVREHARTEREIALEQSRQAHAIVLERERGAAQLRVAYVDHANTPADRYRILRLVLATTQDATLRAWAEGEKSLFDKELAETQRRIEEAESSLAAARAAASAAPPPSNAAQPAASSPRPPPPPPENDVKLQQAKLEEAKARQRAIEGDGF